MEIGIIGSGNVGITTAFAIAEKGSGHITLYGRTDGQAQGKALDLAEAGPIRRYDYRISGTHDISRLFESNILIIAAGKARTAGMDRFELLEDNRCMIQEFAELFKKERRNPEPPVTIVLTEPVDIMTFSFARYSGWPAKNILGVSGLLSVSRFQYFLSRKLGISPADIDAVVLGTHGEKMVILERYCRISGLPLNQFLMEDEIRSVMQETVSAGTEIVEQAKRGSSFYTPGAAAGALVQAIVSDSSRVFSLSTPLDGEYGASGLSASVPVIIGKRGVKKILELNLTEGEKEAFAESLRLQEPHIKRVEQGECYA